MSPDLLSRLAARREHLKSRARVVRAIRAFFDGDDFIEVETPLLLETVAPEAHIEPVRVGDRFLATSPELQMKELVAAGMPRIYQLTRSFRAGERGRRHNPEFTILEWYRPGADVHCLVRDLEGLFGRVAADLLGRNRLTWQGRSIDLAPPWPVTSVRDAFLRLAGWDPVADYDPDRFDLDLVEKVEPHLGRGRPEVLAFYPAPAGSLSRPLPDDPRVCQRMELYVEGMELANGFVELNDAAEQRRRFAAEAEIIRESGRLPPPLPAAFLDSLEALPDTVGIALGVDRMVLLFADCDRLDEVRAFGPDDA